jgi:shikimate kinase
MRYFIIGLPGVGKTHFAKQLSNLLQIDWIDLDLYIEEAEGRSIKEIFDTDGEDVFRPLESIALKKAIQTKPDVVISTGGGTPCFGNHMELMQSSGVCILIKVDKQIVADRIIKDRDIRPMFSGLNREEIAKKLSELWNARKAYYEQTHIITGAEAVQKPQLLTNRLELFTKEGHFLNVTIEND